VKEEIKPVVVTPPAPAEEWKSAPEKKTKKNKN